MGTVATVALVLGAGGAATASAASWAFDGGLDWGGTRPVSSEQRPVVDPSDHRLYVAERICDFKNNCSSTSFAETPGGASVPVDGFCEALSVPEHLFSCPSATGVVRYRAGVLVDTVPVGGRVTATAVDPADGTVRALVADPDDPSRRSLVTLDGTTVTQRIALPWALYSGQDEGLVVDPADHAVWLSASRAADGGLVARVADGVVTATANAAFGVTAPQLDPPRGRVLVNSFDRLLAIGRDGTVTDLGAMPLGADVVVVPDRGEVVVPALDGTGGVLVHDLLHGTTTALDPPAGTVVARLAYDSTAGTIAAVGGGGAGATLALTDAPTVQLGRVTGEQDEDLVRYPVAVFSAPMDRATTEAAFAVTAQGRISGPVEPVAGHLAWIGDRVAVFVPDTRVPFGANWKVTVSAAARSQAGAGLLRAHTWAFATRNVQIRVFPGATTVPASTPIYAIFDQPVDHAFVTTTFLTRATYDDDFHSIGGHAAWLTPQVLTFAPDEPLEPGHDYWFTAQAGDPSRADADTSTAGSIFTIARQP